VTSQTEGVDSAGNVVAGPYGEPGQYVTGQWDEDGDGAAGSELSFELTTDNNGNGYVTNGRVNAVWFVTINWNPACNGDSYVSAFADVNPVVGVPWMCQVYVGDEGPYASTHFVLPGAVPPTITSYGDFSTTYGEPELEVYVGGPTPGLVSTVTAASTVPGSSATFPFPTQSNGSALAEGFYGLVNTNVASGGGLVSVDSSYLAVGGVTTLSSAFGVDAADITVSSWWCTPGTAGEKCEPGTTGTSSTTTPTPIFTQYYAGQVSYRGRTLAVGSEPVAVKEYGTSTVISPDLYYDRVTTTQPASAIVANSGSNSVTILNLATFTTTATIDVGTKPMALTLNSAATYAYVANYGSGTLSEIDLSTNSVSRTATGLNGALSVAMDPSGSYVWVGGANAIYEVSLSTFTVAATASVSGNVTSLAASNMQNELVYTLVENCCDASSTYAASELLTSNLSQPGSYAQQTASPFAQYTMEGTLPTAAALPQATTVVGARFSNGMAASSTPTGFVIYDLVSHMQIMTGTTPTPVRGIASDPDAMYAYFTLPDSNEYISVPLEHTP